MEWKNSSLLWLLILLCAPCWAEGHSAHKSLTPLAALVLVLLFFMLFIYLYSKKQMERKKYLKESVIPTYLKVDPGDTNRDSELIEARSMNAEEKFSKELEPAKLEFIDKKQGSPFELEELVKAPVELVGGEHSGNVYRVVMKNGIVLAVKRMKELQVEGKEFEKRMAFMGNLKHPNVLPIFAYCSSHDENLVIYHYQKKGSLALLLDEVFKGERDLNCCSRLSIIKGIASGLAFMHQEFESQDSIPHGNLKPSNIILSENLEPYIADYGFNSLVEVGIAPTPFHPHTYKAPERRITQKSDVYNFGLILLELLTGKRADKKGFDLPTWVQETPREEWSVKVFDKEMVKNVRKDKMVEIVELGLSCVNRIPEIRPPMKYACDVIDKMWDNEEENASFESSRSSFCSIYSTTGDISMPTPIPLTNP